MNTNILCQHIYTGPVLQTDKYQKTLYVTLDCMSANIKNREPAGEVHHVYSEITIHSQQGQFLATLTWGGMKTTTFCENLHKMSKVLNCSILTAR